MDQDQTLQSVKEWVRGFCEERNWAPYHLPKDLAIGAVTEASELLEIFRFLNREEELNAIRDPKSRAALADELADVFFFLLRFSEMYGFDLSEALRQKLVKNASKYPIGSR